MADNFVYRWEIDNSRAKLAMGRMESEVFEEGGFQWKIDSERHPDPTFVHTYDKAEFTLRCDFPSARSWKCDAEVDIKAIRADGTRTNVCNKKLFQFDENRRSIRYIDVLCWSKNSNFWALEDCLNMNRIVVEVHINILSSDHTRSDTRLFDTPNNKSNVILLIGDKKLHVFKELLAVHSPIFDALFFGDFVEKGKGEVELKDVVYEEFIDLLNVVYPGTTDVTDRTVPHTLKLADRFQMKRVVDQSMKHLLQSKGFDAMKKLLFADQYRLATLKDHCLKSFTSTTDLGKKLQTFPEYSKLSPDMKTAICDRMVKLGF